jgi:hypothetical protein
VKTTKTVSQLAQVVNLGLVYDLLGDYKTAWVYFRKELKIGKPPKGSMRRHSTRKHLYTYEVEQDPAPPISTSPVDPLSMSTVELTAFVNWAKSLSTDTPIDINPFLAQEIRAHIRGEVSPFEPTRLVRAFEHIHRHGKEEGIKRIEQSDPELATKVKQPETARDQILRPNELPYPMTATNAHHWKELVTRAIDDDPDLLQHLLPDTKERALETTMYLADSVNPAVQLLFQTAMWRKLAEIYPNDPEVLFRHSISLPRGADATLEQLREFASFWDHLKEQNEAQNVPVISPFRKTHSLTEAYIAIGEYEKAITNHEEQWKRIDAMRAAGINHRFMYTGIYPRGTVHHLIQATKDHKKEE